jgi:uncharacterized protein YycO
MKIYAFLITVLSFGLGSCNTPEFKDGDIIFHTSKSSQSAVISQITESELTHCGIIFYKKGKPYVIEAVNPVRSIPLSTWVNNGVGGKYKVVRLNYDLRENHKRTMYNYAKTQMGKKYDYTFGWSDSKMYCSELVWKIYNSTGYTLCDTKKFKEYNLSSEAAKREIVKRYGSSINFDEQAVAPVDIFNSDLVGLVYSNY